MRKAALLIPIVCLSCAASAGDEPEPASPPTTIAADGGAGASAPDAQAAWPEPDAGPSLAIDAGDDGCVPGEVVGTAHITNTCYLDCYNACMFCDTPTDAAKCGPYHNDSHAPYCPSMSFIVCPEGSHAERTYMDQSTQYFPGTQHYANETYSCICDEKERGTPE